MKRKRRRVAYQVYRVSKNSHRKRRLAKKIDKKQQLEAAAMEKERLMAEAAAAEEAKKKAEEEKAKKEHSARQVKKLAVEMHKTLCGKVHDPELVGYCQGRDYCPFGDEPQQFPDMWVAPQHKMWYTRAEKLLDELGIDAAFRVAKLASLPAPEVETPKVDDAEARRQARELEEIRLRIVDNIF
jgi:hypothetical protein